MPPHDLEPPKFSRAALERILSDFEAVKQMLLFNHVSSHDLDPSSPSWLFSTAAAVFDEDSGYVDSQSGSIDLDKFVYYLVVKLPTELLVLLVDTIKKKLLTATDAAADDRDNDSELAALAVKRLVRSAARLFSVICMDTFPSNLHIDLSLSSGKTKPGNRRLPNNTSTSANSRIPTIGKHYHTLIIKPYS